MVVYWELEAKGLRKKKKEREEVNVTKKRSWKLRDIWSCRVISTWAHKLLELEMLEKKLSLIFAL